MKKTLITFLALSLVLTSSAAFAYSLPHSFWEPAARYEAAQQSGNKYDLISAGEDIINVLQNVKTDKVEA